MRAQIMKEALLLTLEEELGGLFTGQEAICLRVASYRILVLAYWVATPHRRTEPGVGLYRSAQDHSSDGGVCSYLWSH